MLYNRRKIFSCRQLSSLEEREKELLSKVETIRLLKGNLLKAQVDQIDKATRELNGHVRALRDFLNSANDLDFIKAKKVLPISPVRTGKLIITRSSSDTTAAYAQSATFIFLGPPFVVFPYESIKHGGSFFCFSGHGEKSRKQTQFGGLVPHDRT